MSLTPAERRRLRADAQALPVMVHIGKGGIEQAAQELARQLRAQRLVKVRLLPSATEGGAQDSLQAQALADAVGAELVEVRGHTAVLWRGRA